MVSMFGAGLRLAPVAAVVAALATVGCRGTEEGKIGISVSKEVPGVGPMEWGFEGGWKVQLGNGELCGCVIFLGPDGHPLEGAAVGQIRGGSGGGPVPEGAAGWRAVVTDEGCAELDCKGLFGVDGPGGNAHALAAAWLAAPTDPQRSYCLLGSRLLDDGARQVHSDVGSWQQASFMDVAATVVAPNRGMAWAMLDLCLEAGPAATLSIEQRAALEDRVTIHSAVRLDMDGPEIAPLGFHGEVIQTGAPFGAQVSVNGSRVSSGTSQIPSVPGQLPTVPFYLDLGLVDFEAGLSRSFANRMTIRCKRPGEPVAATRLAMTFEPSDG